MLMSIRGSDKGWTSSLLLVVMVLGGKFGL